MQPPDWRTNKSVEISDNVVDIVFVRYVPNTAEVIMPAIIEIIEGSSLTPLPTALCPWMAWNHRGR